ncbi:MULTISPECIES: hypothetical protein [Roseomonadaceae]|uniref:DUF3592 domain-containing protein n=1 Tax=Falsiroseomonas oleicola TaxID=2801474 RepID=A0ABS6H3T1_9PROT|nr:hypothetical protein [Roseomonas oleicola]MBU8542378.1 hypothetical protein [Roseomonas oleicola]
MGKALREDRPGSPPFPGRSGFMKIAPSAVLAILLAALPVGLLGRSMEIAWIRLVGIQAEAVIVGQPRSVPAKGGPDYWAELHVALPDGRDLHGAASHPIRAAMIAPANGALARRAPQAGDRLAIRLHGRDPVRLTPESALAYGPAPFIEALVVILLTPLLYRLFRSHTPLNTVRRRPDRNRAS